MVKVQENGGCVMRASIFQNQTILQDRDSLVIFSIVLRAHLTCSMPKIPMAILSALYSMNHETKQPVIMSDDPMITAPIGDECMPNERIKRPKGQRVISAGNAKYLYHDF